MSRRWCSPSRCSGAAPAAARARPRAQPRGYGGAAGGGGLRRPLRIGSGNLLFARYVGQADAQPPRRGDRAAEDGLDTLVSGNRAMLADFFYTLRDAGLAIYAEPVEGFPPHHYAQKPPAAARTGDVLFVTGDATPPGVPRPRRRRRGRSPAGRPEEGFRTRRSTPSGCRGSCWYPRAAVLTRAPCTTAMATHVRHPILILRTRPAPGAWTFAMLFFLESVARASLVTVLPLTAYALFGGKEAVSLVYTAVSLAALGFTFAIPVLVRRLSRRWAYTLGAAAARALRGRCSALDTAPALVVGDVLPHGGSGAAERHAALYIMDNIGKRELTRSEPLRLARGDAGLGGRALRRGPADAGRRAVGAGGAQPRRGRRCCSRCSGRCGCARAGRSARRPAAAGRAAPSAGGDPPLRGAAAAAPRLGDRVRAVGVLDHLLRLRADPDRRGRARRRGGRAGGGGRQPHAASTTSSPAAWPSATRCAGCWAPPSWPPPR